MNECEAMAKTQPMPNSYWVVPGRFAVGEYPGAIESSRRRRGR